MADDMRKKIEKWQEPPPAKQTKVCHDGPTLSHLDFLLSALRAQRSADSTSHARMHKLDGCCLASPCIALIDPWSRLVADVTFPA